MLISAVMPLMTIYRLPHGQFGYKGHIINLPQDISYFATSLPRKAKELDILVVRKEGTNSTHQDFRVRRSVVLYALKWLMQHNKYYRHIKIDYDELDKLPVDGNMPNLTVVKEANQLQSYEQQQDDDGTHSSFVPITVKRKSEKEAVQKAVDRQKSKTMEVVPWPARGNVPLNEFISEGYISCASPTLLPTGDADFLAPRQRAVTVGNYLKHLLRYEDGRFAKHPRFRYFALNTEMRWRALQNGRIYIKQHPKDAYLSLSDLKEMVSSGG